MNFVNGLERFGDKAFLVRVFDAEDKLAVIFFGEEIVEESGSSVTNMGDASRAGGDSGAYFHAPYYIRSL